MQSSLRRTLMERQRSTGKLSTRSLCPTETYPSGQFLGLTKKCLVQQSVFPNWPRLSTCTWGSGETWRWTAGGSGWSWPEVLHRQRVQRRAACCGWRTTSRASPWRAMATVELKVAMSSLTRCETAFKVVLGDHMLCFVSSVFLNYFDNPGGMIPTWLINWAAKVSAALCSIWYTVRNKNQR